MVVIGFTLPACSSQQPKVSGTVTFDGQPVSEGAIIFRPTNPDSRPEGGPIRTGKFSVRIRPGSYKVEIVASRPIPDSDTGMGLRHEGYIPSKYNSQTTLSAEVKAAGPNEFVFDLKSE